MLLYPRRDDEYDVRLLIHQSLAGCIIGKGGQKIKEIRDVKRMKSKRDNHSNDDGPHPDKRNRRNDDQVRVLIPSNIAGAIIGKGGQHIQKMRTQYKATVSVDDSQGPEREGTELFFKYLENEFCCINYEDGFEDDDDNDDDDNDDDDDGGDDDGDDVFFLYAAAAAAAAAACIPSIEA
uniref:K Homology domain-containing protein n=1 Tax=Glossina brevipalpis TaxID=37001 RepID=A0A1A9WNX2_9MUSC